MAGAHSKSIGRDICDRLCSTFVPCRGDSTKQVISKIVLLISAVTLIISSSWLANYFLSSTKQQAIVKESRTVWHNAEVPVPERFAEMRKENPDFSAWITLNGSEIDCPVYQTDNDEYYLKHNQKKQSSRHGALFFQASDKIDSKSDKTLVIYGHNMKDGSMFASLKKLRNLNFYKGNPTITLSTVKEDSTYVIYAVFLLNAVRAHDKDYIYDINKSSFSDADDFNLWRDEALERSIINTGVTANYGDDILSLVTCAYDFDDARLVVMARKLHKDEKVSTENAKVNGKPRYPKRWYDERKLNFPW